MQKIFTEEAPTPGAYSQGVLVSPTTYKILFLAGQTGNSKSLENETVVDGGVGPQTTQALKNLLSVVRKAGGSISSFVKLEVCLKDSGSEEKRQADWHEYSQAYVEFFGEHGIRDPKVMPARKQVWVSDIPWATEATVVEIDGIAAIYGW